MNKTNKKIWTKALRSGEYKQGQGYLCRNNEFCCLGVAFDVLCDDYWIQDSDPNVFGIESKDKHTAFLPPSTSMKIGLSEETQHHLTVMNDSGINFDNIANWIEKNL